MYAVFDKLNCDRMNSRWVLEATPWHYLIPRDYAATPIGKDFISSADHFLGDFRFVMKLSLRRLIELCLLTFTDFEPQNVVP